MKRNEFESLKRHGICGSVVSRDYTSKTVYNTQTESLMIFTGQIEPGKWDYGIHYHVDGRPDIRELPGEGEGYFDSEKDAYLFALAQMKLILSVNTPIYMAIDREITANITSTLF